MNLAKMIIYSHQRTNTKLTMLNFVYFFAKYKNLVWTSTFQSLTPSLPLFTIANRPQFWVAIFDPPLPYRADVICMVPKLLQYREVKYAYLPPFSPPPIHTHTHSRTHTLTHIHTHTHTHTHTETHTHTHTHTYETSLTYAHLGQIDFYKILDTVKGIHVPKPQSGPP